MSKANTQIARNKTIRDINKQIVLNYIRTQSPISRADIARSTSLQRSTISAIVDNLLLDGYIDEIGTGDSTGGRKPTLLKLKEGTPAAIGVDVTPRNTTVVLADLGGKILKQEVFPTSSDINFMDRQILEKVVAFADEATDHELAVGISVPGVTDQKTGSISYIPYFQWVNWDIGVRIKEQTGLNVIIDNDANAVALAELWFGAPEIRRMRNFILVMVAEGIGTGIIIDGSVYRGENGGAGEFGHMFLTDNAPVNCSCGRRDCWEAHASEKSIVQRYADKHERPLNGNSDAEKIINLAINGESLAKSVLIDTAHWLGIGISNLIIGFSPQAVVIGGGIARSWDLINSEIETMSRRSIRQELEQTLIMPSALGDSPTTLGSVSLVLARIFASAGPFSE